jgi:hypothetical protein
MKKNIIKFIIIFSLIFGISDSKVFAQFSKKISGEQLEKLLTENYILINGRFGSFKWEFNKDKTYYVFPHHDKTFQMPNNGTWEITGFLGGGSSLILTDRQQIINGRNIKYQFYFGEDGYIYTGSERMHTYSLENIQEKISREARLVEEKRIAEELRLKKIEEEKRQLAIKREQERIKQEQERIKQEEEKKRFQAEYELAVKKDRERREEEEREELYASIVKYSILGLFLLIISFLTYKYKLKIIFNLLKIKSLYLKFINLIQELKNNIPKNNKLTAYLHFNKKLKTNSKFFIFFSILIVVIILYNIIYNFLFVKTIGYCWNYNKYSSYEQSKNDKSKPFSSFQFEINYLKKTVIDRAWWNDQTLRAQGPSVEKYNNIKKNEGGSIITIFSDNLIEIEQDNESVYMITRIYPKTAESSSQGYIKPNRAANYYGEKFSANFKCKHE